MKPITKVFLIIGTLILCLILWSAIFNDGGVLKIAWNALAGPVNQAYARIVGGNTDDARILPMWGGAGNGERAADSGMDGFDSDNFDDGINNVGG